jgi:hypothetical protein
MHQVAFRPWYANTVDPDPDRTAEDDYHLELEVQRNDLAEQNKTLIKEIATNKDTINQLIWQGSLDSGADTSHASRQGPLDPPVARTGSLDPGSDNPRVARQGSLDSGADTPYASRQEPHDPPFSGQGHLTLGQTTRALLGKGQQLQG